MHLVVHILKKFFKFKVFFSTQLHSLLTWTRNIEKFCIWFSTWNFFFGKKCFVIKKEKIIQFHTCYRKHLKKNCILQKFLKIFFIHLFHPWKCFFSFWNPKKKTYCIFVFRMELIFFATRFHSKQFLAWFFKIIFGKNNCIWFPTWHKKTFPEYDFFWKRVFILQKEENIHFIHEKEHLQHMEWKSLPKKNCTHLYTWRKCFPLKFHFIHLWHFFLLKKLFHLVLHMKKKILSPENVHSISPMDFWKLLFWIKNISLNIFYIWKKRKESKTRQKQTWDQNQSVTSSWEHEDNFMQLKQFIEYFSLDPSINTGMSGACSVI